MRFLSQPFYVRIFLALRYLVQSIFRPTMDEKLHLYGIYGFLGLPGHGKTVALT